MNNEDTIETRDDDDNNIESVEEMKGHDRLNAEEDSVKSVADTATTKKQPKRRGDKSNAQASELKPKTKAGVIKDMYDHLNSLDKEELDELYDAMMNEDTDDEGTDTEEEVYVEINFKEDLDDLIKSEATLSEEFKDKTAVIFEAALNSKLKVEVNRIEEEYQSALEESKEELETSMVDKIDSYLNFVVETWMEDNKLAVESGLRTEIAENFMTKLKDVFEESYIDVPESKIDLVDDLADQVEELEAKLNESTVDYIAMSEELEKYQKEDIIRENTSGLADTEVEKLKSLVEGVEFDDKDSYAGKVQTVKESLFNTPKKTNTLNEDVTEAGDDNEETQELSSVMESYVTALRKSK
jgi:hypothetical protein